MAKQGECKENLQRTCRKISIQSYKVNQLHSVINDFWINETGDLEVVIRYKPQDWFELGLGISAATFIGCISYLLYDWRREGRVQ